MSRAFLDSNILLYGIDLEDDRRRVAQHIIRSGALISVQCLNEFATVARRKLGLAWAHIDASVDEILDLCAPVCALTLETHKLGLQVARKYRLSIYDAMIVAAALIAECDVLYSEDMHHGLVIEGRLRIENPFLA